MEQPLPLLIPEKQQTACIIDSPHRRAAGAIKIDKETINGNINIDQSDKNYALLEACRNGPFGDVKQLIEQGAAINCKDLYGRTCMLLCSTSLFEPIEKIELVRSKGGNSQDTDDNNENMLHLACRSGTLETVRHLINQGLDIHTKGRMGRTCILLCSQSQTQAIEKIELLRLKGGNIFDIGEDKHTMLHLACMSGTLDTVRHLIGLGVDINAKCRINGTCILHCCQSETQTIEKIEFLGSKGGNINDTDIQNNGILHKACAFGTLDTVKYLIDLGLDINTRGFNGGTCMLCCCQSEKQAIEKIELLRSKGGNIYDTDDDNSGMLHAACISSTLDTVKYLIDQGLDINAKGLNSSVGLLYSCQSDTQAIGKIELLRLKGANIYATDENNNSMLHLACISGTLNTVEYLIDLGLDINTRGFNGSTCILSASKSKTQAIEKIELLRLMGGNIYDTDDQNNDILHMACAFGTLDTVKYLVDLGLDINRKGLKGRKSILHCCQSETQPIEKIELLRSKGASVYDNGDDNNGMLHLACVFGTFDTVRYLVDLGLDIHTKGFKNRTCVLMCSESEIQAINKIELLRSMGADISNAVLNRACAFSTLDTVRYLLDLGLDINTKDHKGRTCILQCTKSKRQAIDKIELVRSKGGNIYDTDDNSNGMLQLACISGTLDTVGYLIGLGLNINNKGFQGRSCILLCSESKIQAVDKIELLRSKGGNIHDKDGLNNGNMLHIACANGTVDTVQYLVKQGLDTRTKDESGNTPVSLSFRSGVQSHEKVEYLKSKGAKLPLRMRPIYHIRKVLKHKSHRK
ncbi:ankyrin repeat and KH domain-containing protein 1 [Patella vulgata]|uniref:ankyrin repeat and KH domain-containing protein 1 n=1 Tax=Patella vulgata TaxID=6465 RepID=UPI00217FD1D6|nr:ankyrin repeat and KH domain-containing protein 1 [Patella vulgata]XP_050390971.1 ankyrin repeat and KH domain-containing protein 1 [Patella vulgata]XP_050390973.1 ankyrin repeat and KH domain-containing protein 1 [Patella vulgata]XP_050390974.1 ankyrin repeat and KH domain-containing protein 1 [Patella vulgata]